MVGGYFGRGFLQITHEENYRKAWCRWRRSVKEPSKALDPAISAKIAVLGMRDGWFTGKRLSDFITLAHSDFEGARAIVNGDKNKKPKVVQADHRRNHRGRSAEYEAALKVGYGEEKPVETAPKRGIPRNHLRDHFACSAERDVRRAALGGDGFASHRLSCHSGFL